MEEDLVQPRVDKRAYIKARLIEAIDDIDVAVNLWLSGRTRNAAGKAFQSVKALLSALVTKELDRLGKVDQWYVKRGYTAPTHSMNGIALDLAKLGYGNDVVLITLLALQLHDYQCNGFDPDFSKYRTKEEVLYHLNMLADILTRNLKAWFSDYWDEKLETLYSITISDLEKLKGRAD